MKTKILLYSISLVVVCLFSCKKDAIIDYQGKNSIYFEGEYDASLAQYVPKNIGEVSFGYIDGAIKELNYIVIVNSMGKPVDYNRTYALSVVDTSTLLEGVDFEFVNKNFFIPAGKTQDSIHIKLKRNIRLSEVRRLLSLKLSANDQFNIDMPNETIGSGNQARLEQYTSFQLRVDDIVGCPWFWDPLLNKNATRIELYLGPFTPRKFQLLIARYGLDIATVTKVNYMPLPGQLLAWAFDMQSYLDEQSAKGQPIYEADGVTLMKLGPAAK